MVTRFSGRRWVTWMVVVATAFVLAIPAAAGTGSDGDFSLGISRLRPINDPDAEAFIFFRDDGETLRIRGFARGLDPNIPYASLIYDNKSVANGPEACEPAAFPPDPDSIITTMFVGFWEVRSGGFGVLRADNIVDDDTGERVHVPLDRFRTISIRDLTVEGPFGPGSGPAAVMACGVERTVRP